MSVNQACWCNISSLEELIQLLEFMSDETYQKQKNNNERPPSSSIGAHCRHVIEFYQSFFQGVSEGVIDYDNRHRDIHLEQSRNTAIIQLDIIKNQLTQLTPAMSQKSFTLRVQMNPKASTLDTATSITRELVFLQSHCVHHLAFISLLLNIYGQTSPENFGVAISTRIFRDKQRRDKKSREKQKAD